MFIRKKAVPLQPFLQNEPHWLTKTQTIHGKQNATYYMLDGTEIPQFTRCYDSRESLLPMYGYADLKTLYQYQMLYPRRLCLRGFFMSPPTCSGCEHTYVYKQFYYYEKI